MKSGSLPSGRLPKSLQLTIAATGSLVATWAAAPAADAAGPAFVSPASDPFNAWSVGFAGGYHLFSTPTSVLGSDSYSTDGGSGFLQADVGRDVHMGKGVFGLHGDVQFGHTDAGMGSFECGENYTLGDTINWGTGAAVTGRVGMTPRPDTLVYGLFGWTWQQYAASMSTCSPPTNTHGWVNGPTIGAGIETMVAGNRNMTLTAEYRASQLGLISSDNKGFQFGDTTVQSVTVGVSFKLGNGGPRLFP